MPTIYGYTLPDVADHNGYIKIGYTDREDTETRIKEQLHTAAIPFRILFKGNPQCVPTELALRIKIFTDY